MPKYKDLIVWQKAHELAKSAYKITNHFPESEKYGLTAQLRRAMLSIPTNIVEGYNRKSKKEFKHFLDIALGSQAESMYLIEFSKDMKFISEADAQSLLDNLDELGRIIWSLRRSIP